MRLALISDLHASLGALDAVLADTGDVDRVVCLGDVVDLGPEPAQTLERLRERDIPIVRGNHDPLDEHPGVPMLLEAEAWTHDQLSEEQRAFLASRPLERVEDLEGLQVLCVHASPRSLTDQILAETDADTLRAWWGDRAFDVLVCGHTHVQLARRVDDRLVVNVGSVGQPFLQAFDGGTPPRVLPWSEYAVVSHEAGRVSVDLRRIPFDVDAYAAILRSSGFPQPEAWLAHWVSRRCSTP